MTDSSGAIDRLREWVRRVGGTELPCGCIAGDGRGAEFSNDTDVVNRDIETLHKTEYTNATKYERRWVVTIRCDQCGSEWEKTKRAGSRVDYGDPNPGASQKLETEMRGRSVIHREVPVIDRGGSSD